MEANLSSAHGDGVGDGMSQYGWRLVGVELLADPIDTL